MQLRCVRISQNSSVLNLTYENRKKIKKAATMMMASTSQRTQLFQALL